MGPVIVPLDGSRLAESALTPARAVASGDPIVLVRARDDGAQEPVAYLELRAAELAGEDVETMFVHDRPAPEAIALVARQHPGAMVCMATHGRSGLGEEVLGSVAEEVVRSVECPVVLVGPDVDAEVVPTGDVVLAVDTVTTARAIAPVARDLASRHHLRLLALEITPPAPIPMSDAFDTRDGAAAAEAAELLGGTAQAMTVRDGEPARAIVRIARERPASYVVMRTHGRSGFARVALGSVAMRVVHRAPCPVVVVRS
jgi:nucleotide-binding universal stress UspA family protein